MPQLVTNDKLKGIGLRKGILLVMPILTQALILYSRKTQPFWSTKRSVWYKGSFIRQWCYTEGSGVKFCGPFLWHYIQLAKVMSLTILENKELALTDDAAI